MDITRYQFELLTFVEARGPLAYSVREFADTLCLSGTLVDREVNTLTALGLLACTGQTLSLTPAGLEALEPYRVKRAVILAAGFGSRMMPATAHCPKPMVAVNGRRIIETLLDALTAVGIRDITLVRGYQKASFDALLEQYPFLQLVDNDDYQNTNNISSAMLVLDKLTGCYLCEADLYITNPAVITKYQYCSNILGSYALETDDWCFEMEKGAIANYRKGGTYCYNYYGISYWTAQDCANLRRDFAQVFSQEPEGKDYFWEFIPLVLRKDRYRVEIRPCKKSDIMEIDNYYELAQLDPSYR